jgi:uncharacterized glyoxalase superfamily protein PhnB
MATPLPPRPALMPALIYRDNRAALEWLQNAFGFEIVMVLTDSKGAIVHAEMSHRDGLIAIGYEWTDWAKSPASVGGKNTQRLHVYLESGIDKHCERARRAGAKIVMEPNDQFYGDRTYVAQDLDGHHWTFAQPVRDVGAAEMEQASGFKFSKTL